MRRRLVPPLFAFLALVACACAASAPQPKPSSPPSTRRVPTQTPTPARAASALGVVPLKIEESPLPPPEPTPTGFASGRATATPFATPETAWKYVTITFAVENRSDTPWLVGIGGSEPSTTNLASAVLTTADGARYKPIRSSTTLGLRTATSHALVSYPVLLRLPPSYRAYGESAGSLSVIAPDPNSLTFKVPSTLSDLGTLAIPPLASLGPKSGDDDVSRLIRPLVGGFAPTSLSGFAPSNVTFPTANPASNLAAVGSGVPVQGKATITLVKVDATDPDDFELRNRGWKQVTLSIQYHNDDQQPQAFNVAAWLFGEDGVVYTGDAPTVGDFGRLMTAPDAAVIPLWDGRSAGTNQIPAGQALEPRRATFIIPRALRNAVLVLSGDLDAAFNVTEIPVPPQH